MKRTYLWTAPAIAAALWLGGPAGHSAAQSAGDATAGAATDAASSTSSSPDAASSTSSSADAEADASKSSGASTSSESVDSVPSTVTSPSSDTAATATGRSDVQADAQPQADANATTAPSAAASTAGDTQTPPTVPSIQADASADASLDANAPQPENATPGSTSADIAVQGQAGVNADSQLDAQQNLQAGLQFGQATDRGLAINAIAPNHFFYNSGLRRGDVIVSYGGRPIRSNADFSRWVLYQPGQRVPVVVLREGRPETIYVVYQNRRPGFEYQAGYGQTAGGAYLGVTFDQQNPRQAQIRTVHPGSPAERAGLRPGDVIIALNDNQIGGLQDVIRTVSSMQAGQPLDVAISRRIVLDSRPGVAQASYAPDVTIQGSASPTSAAPTIVAPPAVAGAAVETGAYVESDDVVPGGARVDNTPARAGDTDGDGRLLDGDGRVGPVEGRAILPSRRN